jgi:hypothetical protein
MYILTVNFIGGEKTEYAYLYIENHQSAASYLQT